MSLLITSKKVSYILFIFVLIFILIICVGKLIKNYTSNSFNENFGNWATDNNFSPYNNPQQKDAKIQDYVLLDSRIQKFESPNKCDNGYVNLGWPPSNPLYNYPSLTFHPYTTPEQESKVVYGDPFEKRYSVGIMGNV